MPIKDRFDNYERKTQRTKKKFLMPCYNNYDIYKFYKQDIPHKAKTPYNINKKVFNEILDLYNIALTEIIKTGVCLAMPNKLGGIQLVKVRVKGNPDKNNGIKQSALFDPYFYIPVTHWIKYRYNCKARLKNIKMYCFKLTKETISLLRKQVDNEGLGNKLFTVRPS